MASSTMKQGKVKVLFVAANPTSVQLRLDEEIREITQKILAAHYRDLLDIKQIWAARPDDLLQYLNMHKPHIVHFSAHGSPTGEIILTDNNGQTRPVSTGALKALFTTLKDNIRVVLLNACYSQIQAKAITDVIDCAIGMNDSIGDDAAITFAASFYRALGFGRSIYDAYEQGKVALQLEGIPEYTTPHLLCKMGVDPSQICIITTTEKSNSNASKNRLKLVQDALLDADYNSAYRSIDNIVGTSYDQMSSQEKAKLKYLEALVYLEGKRPFTQSPSVMKLVEGFMSAASHLYHIYSYLGILAIFKYDFARSGLRKQVLEAEANRLMEEVHQCPLKAEDRENITILSKVQPHLYRDFRCYLRV